MTGDEPERDGSSYLLTLNTPDREFLIDLGCSDEQVEAIIRYYRKKDTRLTSTAGVLALFGLVSLFAALAITVLLFL